MILNIEVTAVKQAGVLGKIAMGLIKSNYKIVSQSVADLDDDKLCLVNFCIEANDEVANDELDFLNRGISQIISIKNKNDASLAQTTSQTTGVEVDLDKMLNNYGQQLIGQYPNISDLLKKIDKEAPQAIKQELFSKLGKGFGRWQYQKNYALGGLLPLDKTLQRVLGPAVSEFLDIEVRGGRIQIRDCPHCEEQTTKKPSCYFITAYMEGFLGALSHLPSTSVVQLYSKASGHQYCSFEVKNNAK